MLLMVVSLLMLGYASASDSACDVGTATSEEDLSTFLSMVSGNWTVGYVKPTNISSEKSCWTDDYKPRADGGSDVISTSVNYETGETYIANCSVTVKGRYLYYDCPGDPEPPSTEYMVLAWEKDKFHIAGGCMEVFGNQPVNWISFLKWPPSEDVLQAVKEALIRADLSFDDFALDCGTAE